jgi:glycosyltransferase involved in cell wall biosynthesis
MPRTRRVTVTVLMAVHNDLRFLPDAVESICRQTFDDFNFVIVDDGSTDGSSDYLRRLRDPRIYVLHNEQNVGLTASLNRGLAECGGERYVARMDADDISEPDRLARQVEFLDAHADVGIVGSSRRLIDEAGKEITIARAVETDLAIRWKCLLGNPFAHPTVMIRGSVLARHRLRYDESFRSAQDYELWTRILPHARGANLAEPLLRYRMRDGISRRHKAEQLANHDRIACLSIQRLLPGFHITPDEVTNLRGRYGGFSVRDPASSPDDPIWTAKLLEMRNAFQAAYRNEPGIDAFIDTSVCLPLASHDSN